MGGVSILEDLKIGFSFDDCPYHCTNGYIFDYEISKKVLCPHCSKKRDDLIHQGSLEVDGEVVQVDLPAMLGVKSKYLSSRLSYDLVVPDSEKVFITDESLEFQKTCIEDLYLSLSLGKLPDSSYCFGLGVKGYIDALVYPLLAKAYSSGVSVAPFISCERYSYMLNHREDAIREYLDADLAIMLISDGSSKAGVFSAKGFMQERAINGKPTVFVSTWQIEACSMLLGTVNHEGCFLAKPVFVHYKKSRKKSNYINQLTGVDNTEFNGYDNSNTVSMEDLLNL